MSNFFMQTKRYIISNKVGYVQISNEDGKYIEIPEKLFEEYLDRIIEEQEKH